MGEGALFLVERPVSMGETRQDNITANGTASTAPPPDQPTSEVVDMASPKPSTAPAFQFYPRDFLSSTKVQRMSLTEMGIYIKFLSLCWLDGSLPADTKKLAGIVAMKPAQFDRIWSNVLNECFTQRGDRLVNRRLDEERRKQAEHRQRQSDNGKLGGRPKKAVGFSGLEVANPEESHSKAKKSSSSSSSSSSKEHVRDEASSSLPGIGLQRKSSSRGLQSSDDLLARFERFWVEYPRKTAKEDARKEFFKLSPDDGLANWMIEAVRRARASAQWTKDDGQFILHARTWLHQKRWEDETDPPPPGGQPMPRRSNVPDAEASRRRRQELFSDPN